MPVDILARAQAGAASASAVQALSRTNTIELFAQFGSLTIDASVSTISSTGFAAVGVGRGVYVADAKANAALAARFPVFCKKTANNRYFRLVGPAVTPEQAGATGAVGTNDQPAIQTTIDYATAMGVPEVHLKGAYEAWCPQRTSPLQTQADDGHLLVIRGNIAIIGLGAGATINRRNYLGADPVNQQTMANPAEGRWRGGGLFWTHTGTIDQNTTVILRNFKLDGGINQGSDFTAYDQITTQDGWDLTDKGIWVQDLRSGTLIMEDVEITRFRGEINYWSGYSDATSTDRLSMTRCFIHETNGDANNATGGYAEFHHCRFGKANSAEEALGRSGHRYYDCEFFDCNGLTFVGGPDPIFQTGYIYTYPIRQPGYVPWIELSNCTFRNCKAVQIGNWVRGNVTAIDSYFNAGASDVALTINAWLDSASGYTAVIMSGPPTLTTQFDGCPAGVYVPPVERCYIKVNCFQTRAAAAAGNRWGAVFAVTGIISLGTCSLTSDYAIAQNVWVPYGPASGLRTIPAITCGQFVSQGVPYGGTSDAPSADVVYTPTWSAVAISPASAGPINVTLSPTYAGTTFTFEDGARAIFCHNGAAGRQLRFAEGGAGLALKLDRVLINPGDLLELRYSAATGKWHEERFGSSVPVEATAIDMWTGTSSAKTVTPRKIYDMAATQALADAPTIAVDFNAGINFSVTLAGNRTLANPVNAKSGQSGVIRVSQDGSGGRTLAYGTNWRFPGGSTSGGVLSAGANAIDVVAYFVGNDGLVYATLAKGFAA